MCLTSSPWIVPSVAQACHLRPRIRPRATCALLGAQFCCTARPRVASTRHSVSTLTVGHCPWGDGPQSHGNHYTVPFICWVGIFAAGKRVWQIKTYTDTQVSSHFCIK